MCLMFQELTGIVTASSSTKRLKILQVRHGHVSKSYDTCQLLNDTLISYLYQLTSRLASILPADTVLFVLISLDNRLYVNALE